MSRPDLNAQNHFQQLTQDSARGEEPCPSPIEILIDRYLRDETESSTGNLVQLHHHHVCSTDRFFGHDWLFATHR